MDGLENLEGRDREEVRAALQDAIAAREPDNAGCKDCPEGGMCSDHQADADKAETYRGLFARTDEPQREELTDWAGSGYQDTKEATPAIEPFGDAEPGSDEERRNIMGMAGKYFSQPPVRTEPIVGYTEWRDGAYHTYVPGEGWTTSPDMAGVFNVLGSTEPVPRQYETDREAG